jgi:hypothetical protein
LLDLRQPSTRGRIHRGMICLPTGVGITLISSMPWLFADTIVTISMFVDSMYFWV